MISNATTLRQIRKPAIQHIYWDNGCFLFIFVAKLRLLSYMNKITFSHNDCKEETTSIWLLSVLQYGLKLEFFKPLENFKLKMKKIKFSVYQKLITIIMSIVVGCEFMKDINEKLGLEKLSANLFDMDNFPDQSQLNKVLNRFDSDSISQLENIHHKLFIENSSSAFTDKEVVIDFDQTELIANGKSYASASKGYFSKKKNQSGYQMSAAFTGEHFETVAMYLDSGNTHCQDHFKDLLKSTLSKYKDALKSGNLIICSDSGYGSLDIIELMKSIPNLKFVTKGYSTIREPKILLREYHIMNILRPMNPYGFMSFLILMD